MKRFYKDVCIEQSDGSTTWKVTLDGKAVKTPKGSLLELPTQKLAEQVRNEWDAQTEYILPRDMRVTTLCCTTLDMVRPDAGVAAVDRMLPYLETDTLCFVDENELLAERQRSEWGELIQWFNGRFGVDLAVSTGLSPPKHPEETLDIVKRELLQRDAWELCALEVATTTAKSLIVACALLERADVGVKEAFQLGWLEEHFQIERWGLVEGEHDVSHEDAQAWLSACRMFSPQHRC